MGVCWCVSAVRDSPPANEASEETEEPMAVPEDLSASSTHQQNNRGEKGTKNAPQPVSQNAADARVGLSKSESVITVSARLYPM